MDFDELYQNYADTVYSFLMFKLRNRELAEDLLQETFLGAYKICKAKGQVASPRAWVLSIARNKMVDHLRKQGSPEVKVPVELLEDTACSQDSSLFVREMLERLADQERTIIYGLYVAGLSCKELAQILRIPEGTVKSKSHYARKKLKTWLREEKNEIGI